ncbi:hypothetical protein GJ654_05535 [Rhodoblastus acidophilus]|uniref:Uncharacterized protein n=1 Tax=Rhodoblastus acidophilus TaxID=1074 RepID=A0A6N8DIW9_RHOAC|nr:hypothetical protein [Rhodoblastus acidophilus]MCW2273462.1 hypothetical protein [Rhodoblastus acidophilus]MTV30452.1 hypothetical protein [Rhodoblastus acidophilus]
MRLIRFLLLAVMIGVAAPTLTSEPAKAAPVAGSILGKQTLAPDLTEKARVYCYNRYTGRFLHWGPCHRRHYRPHHYYYRPYYRPYRHYYRPHRHYYHRHYYW